MVDKKLLSMLIRNSLYLVIYYVVALILYDVIAEATLARAHPVFYSPLDYIIFFNPIFVIFYVFIFTHLSSTL